MGAYDCDCINNLEYEKRERKAQLSQEGTTSDTISRQAVLDALMNSVTPYGFIDADGNIESGCKDKDVVEMLYNLPSAQPEPQEGEWEQVSAQRYFMSASYFYRCSACGVNNVRNTNFCPNRGAKMKGAEHETN